jgi:hypothetical protein
MRRAVILCGTVSFVMAFLGGILALGLMTPALASAQSSQLQEVRASAFTLVGADGMVLASLQPSAVDGSAVLVLFDAAGTRRLNLFGAGVMNVYDQDGVTQVFRAGRTYERGVLGQAPVNGVELGPNGSVSVIPPLP